MIQDPVRRHALLLALIVATVALLRVSATLQSAFIEALQISRGFIERHPLASRLAFVEDRRLAFLSVLLAGFGAIGLVTHRLLRRR